MAHETTHILYEWESYAEVEIRGKMYRYPQGPYSLILHRLDALKHFPQIPADARKTPCWYSGYTEKWYRANGHELIR